MAEGVCGPEIEANVCVCLCACVLVCVEGVSAAVCLSWGGCRPRPSSSFSPSHGRSRSINTAGQSRWCSPLIQFNSNNSQPPLLHNSLLYKGARARVPKFVSYPSQPSSSERRRSKPGRGVRAGARSSRSSAARQPDEQQRTPPPSCF